MNKEEDLVNEMLVRVAGKVMNERDLSPEEAIAWLEERMDKAVARAIVRTVIASFMTFGERGDDPDEDAAWMVGVMEEQIRGELEGRWAS